MTLAYAAKGLVGLLTPQGNTTVEPECAMLWPPGFGHINARLVSQEPSIEARLRDYYLHLGETLAQFGAAPVQVVASTCTGASYLLGAADEDALFAELAARWQRPVTNSALASAAALRQLQAKRIGLVSPYPEGLTQASVRYWQARGFEVAALAMAEPEAADATFHPIYSLGHAPALQALQSLPTQGLDAVLLLGTGMPTLAAMAAYPRWGQAPVLSCLLATVWQATQLVPGAHVPSDDVLALLDQGPWRAASLALAQNTKQAHV
ncbi:MAG: maleate cis-trans isomerase family protein [Burkholderiaceae bacterium]|jgi:maleate isomerase